MNYSRNLILTIKMKLLILLRKNYPKKLTGCFILEAVRKKKLLRKLSK